MAIALLPVAARAQQTGSVSGQVTDATSQRPLGGAQVMVVGTTRATVTDQQGRYTITGVPAGPQRVRAGMLGYSETEQTATVAGGSTATVDFRLSQSALQVSGLVVTATGREQRQREIGSSVGVVNPTEVPMATIANTAQLLQGRVAGAVVMPSSGTVGSGYRVRIRGNNSLSLSNAPLVVVDGVRVESSEASLGFGVGGQTPSRLNDINPQDIESLEILKGPAASALYGTAAANGVIQITTKRGRAGAPQFHFWTEYGALDQTAKFPVNTYAVGNTVTATNPNNGVQRCDILRLAIGSTPKGNEVGCTGITQVYTFSPLTNPETSPFQDGNRNDTGISVSGGNGGSTYYVSTSFQNEHGVLPDNHLRRIGVQANTTSKVGEKLTIGTNIGYLTNRMQLPNSDNALFGILPMGLTGSPLPANVEANQGFASNPGFFYDWITHQRYGRFTGAARGDFQALDWLSINGNVGLDRYQREDRNRIPRVNAYGPVYGSVYTNGFIQNYTYDIYDLTSNLSATATRELRDDLVSTTSIGGQYLRENLHRIYAFGAGMTPGIETSLAGATSDFEAGEDNTLNATVSAYAQQQFAWRDRVFVNAAVRGDQNTSFGGNIGWIWYPAINGAWVISDEPFFPQISFLDHLRLRGGYGQSGVRPGPTDAIQAFGSNVTAFGTNDVAAIAFNLIGNPDLKPERTNEWEAGFETGLFGDRLGVDLTYFNKTSVNALVSKPLPPSLGSAASRFENLGRVDNNGLELTFRGQPVRTANLNWDFELASSWINNKLVDIGRDAQGNKIPPITAGGFSVMRQTHVEGLPLGSYYSFPAPTYADANGDGLLSPSEVQVRKDTTVYLGTPFPKREVSFNTGVRYRDWLKISTMLDYKGGNKMFNLTHANRCGLSYSNCADLYDVNTPLAEQAAIVAMRNNAVYSGFIEDASFVKLREVAVTLGLPQTLAQRFNASGLSVTLAGRNLKTWTDYTGLDPEVNSQGQANFTTVEGGTLPANRVFTIRVDANF